MSMQSEAGSGLTERQRWADIARGMQQDLAAYAGLRDLLQTQFHAALRHDAAAMEEVARQIAAQVQQLDGTRQQRSLHARALLPAGAALSMTALFSLLQPPLQQQLQALWAQLQVRVQECKACNLRNCQLILEQAEVMRSVIAGSSQPDIYVPF